MSATAPITDAAPVGVRSGGVAVLVRAVLWCSGIAAAVVGVALADGPARSAEARLAAFLADALGVARTLWLGRAEYVISVGRPNVVEISPACSALYLCVPIAAVALLLGKSAQVRRRSAIVAFAAGALVLFLTNQVRLLVTALLVRALGESSGFRVGHLGVGVAVSLVGVAAGAATTVAVMQRLRRTTS